MNWKELLGDGESFTIEDIDKATTGMNLIDLSEGNYFPKEKYDKKVTKDKADIERLEGELKELKDAGEGDEALKTRITKLEADNQALTSKLSEAETEAEDARTAYTSKEREVLVSQTAEHLNPKMRRALLQDAEALTSDTVEFTDALAKAMKDDADYAKPEGDAVTVGTGPAAVRGVNSKDPYIAAIDAALPSRESVKVKE